MRQETQDPEFGRRLRPLGRRGGRGPLPDVAAHPVYAEGADAVVEVPVVDGRGAGRLLLVDLPVLQGVAGEAVFALHIYLGTIGMRGAYRAMRDGWVGDAWAEEHHKLWADDVLAGRIPRQRSREPERPAAPQRA